MNYYNQYLKTEELDWFWTYNELDKSFTLTLTHLPSNISVNGTIKAIGQVPLTQRKRDLHDSLTEKLQEVLFG